MKGNSGCSIVVIADGVEYSSIGQAATALGLSNSAVSYRMGCQNFPTFHRKGETKSADLNSDQVAKAIIINGVEYPSISQAATALGESNTTVRRRANDPNFPNYRWKTTAQQVPEAPVIIDGVEYARVKDAALAAGISVSAMHNRLKNPNFPTCHRKGETKPSRSRKTKPVEEKEIVKPLIEPKAWPFDGGLRRAQVLNPNFDPPLVIRRIGWLRCMVCGLYHFSEDISRVRICRHCGGYGGDVRHKG